MGNAMDKKTVATISRVLTDQPVEFDVGGKRYRLYPVTLGKLHLVAPLFEAIGLDRTVLAQSPFLEILRVVKEHTPECLRIIAYHTLRTKREILAERTVSAQAERLSHDLSDEDAATLLLTILQDNAASAIAKATGMEREAEDIVRVNKAKDKGNSFIFGGKTVWGALIDAACERYGWTLDYVVWGISHANLTLLLRDKVTSIYLTDKERKRVHLPDRGGGVLSGDDRAAVMRMAMESESNPL